MSETVTIEQAQTNLAQLIARLLPGHEVIITNNNQPVAELRPLQLIVQPQFGNCRGGLTILAEDEEYLEDFAEYMP